VRVSKEMVGLKNRVNRRSLFTATLFTATLKRVSRQWALKQCTLCPPTAAPFFCGGGLDKGSAAAVAARGRCDTEVTVHSYTVHSSTEEIASPV